MSMNTVSVVGPRAEPQEQKKEKKDPLDQILQGLQIAQGISGIAVNFTTIQKHMAEQQGLDDKNIGVQPDSERQAAIEKGLSPVPEGTPGSQTYQYRTGDGAGGVTKQAFILPQKAEKETGSVKEVQGPNGPIFAHVTSKNASEYQPYIAPQKPGKDITIGERNTLQTQYDRDPSVRKNRLVFSSFAEAQTYANEKSPASDLSLIMAYYKANDPSSVVKESEAETAQALGGVEQRAKAWFAKNAGEAGLTDRQRTDLLRAIELKAQTAAKDQDGINKSFGNLAGRRGVNTQDIRLVDVPTFESQRNSGGGSGGDGTALGATDKVPGHSVSDIEAEIKRRGLKTNRGASGGY